MLQTIIDERKTLISRNCNCLARVCVALQRKLKLKINLWKAFDCNEATVRYDRCVCICTAPWDPAEKNGANCDRFARNSKCVFLWTFCTIMLEICENIPTRNGINEFSCRLLMCGSIESSARQLYANYVVVVVHRLLRRSRPHRRECGQNVLSFALFASLQIESNWKSVC